MSPYMEWSIFSRTASTLVCGTLLLMVLLQLRQDTRSRAFAGLVGVIGANTALSLILRFYGMAGLDIHWLFQCSSLLTSSLPMMLFLFVVAYFDAWTPFRKRVTYAYFLFIGVVTVLNVTGVLIRKVELLPNGLIHYELNPISSPLLILGFLGAYLALYIAWEQQRRASDVAKRRNRQIVFGVSIIVIGGMVMMVPALTPYTIEHVAYMIGALVIAGPVFRQRLFDPIAQLNAKLQQRADQLATINAVSQQANAMLSVNSLLDAVAQRIQRDFGYVYVSISTPNAQAVAGKCSNDLAVIPFVLSAPGPDGTRVTVGQLDIQVSVTKTLSTNDHEVLSILASQVAIAIQNAALFERVQEANQAKTRFIHIIGHELRSPLQVLLGTLEALSIPELYSGVVLNDEYLTDLRRVKKSSDDLHTMLDDILDMARIEAGAVQMQIREVDVLPILTDLAESFSVQVRPDVAFKASYVNRLPTILADDLRLKQILSNLLGNACKFTVQGSITLDAQVHKDMLHISVSDTGPGVAKSVQARLFTNFAQGSRQFGGAGLGLSISRQFAQMQHGDVWFESKEGQGATFFCSVPLAKQFAGQPAQVPSKRSQVTFLKKADRLPALVLVIGVEVDRLAYIYQGDAHPKYRLMSALDSNLGIALARAASPSLILCVDMPLFPEQLNRDPELKACKIVTSTASQWREVLALSVQTPEISNPIMEVHV